jgi:hypothetical protein
MSAAEGNHFPQGNQYSRIGLAAADLRSDGLRLPMERTPFSKSAPGEGDLREANRHGLQAGN